MNDKEIRDTLIKLAYEKARQIGYIKVAKVNPGEIDKFKELEKNILGFNVDYLVGSGLLEYADGQGSIVITPHGIDYFENKKDQSNK